MFGKWRSYSCYICGKRASGPQISRGWMTIGPSNPEGSGGSIETEYKDNNLPENLSQCPDCDRWYCGDCSGGWGLCKKCGQRKSDQDAASVPEWQKRINTENTKRAAAEKIAKESKEQAENKARQDLENARKTAYQAKYHCYL